MTGQQKLKIDIIGSADELECLQSDWEKLSAADARASVFSSWTWQSSWWQQYGNLPGTSRELYVLVARCGETGETLGILPTYIEQTRIMRSVPVRTIALVGTGGDTSPDYLNPLASPGCHDAVDKAFARSLAELPWSVMSFHDLGADSGFRDALVESLADRGIHHDSGQSADIAWIDLPDDWPGYLASLSSNRRYQIRSQRRKFESAGDTRFYVWQDAGQLDQAVDKLIELHLKRWQDRAADHAFASRNYVDFHRAVMHDLLEKGQLRLYCLELDGELVAMLYCYCWKSGIYFFQAGFDPDYEKLRVGNVVMAYALEHAIEEGHHVFDMLKGDYRYKRSLAKQRNQTWYVSATRSNFPGLAYRLRYEVLPGIKSQLTRAGD